MVLAGVHVGCFELFGNESMRALRDLRGKSVGVRAFGSSPYLFLGPPSWSRGKARSCGGRSYPLTEARSSASVCCDRLDFGLGFCGSFTLCGGVMIVCCGVIDVIERRHEL